MNKKQEELFLSKLLLEFKNKYPKLANSVKETHIIDTIKRCSDTIILSHYILAVVCVDDKIIFYIPEERVEGRYLNDEC